MEVLRSPLASPYYAPQTPVKRNAVKSTARRCLFGTPSKAANDAFLSRMLAEMHATFKAKWEFDFSTGTPLPSSSSSRFEYSPVNAAEVPGFYRASSVGSCGGASEESASDAENREPDSSSEEDSFRSEDEHLVRMESSEAETLSASREAALFKAKKTAVATPKKRQSKLTDFMTSRKHLQRSAKKSDLVARSPAAANSSRTSRRSTRSLLLSA